MLESFYQRFHNSSLNLPGIIDANWREYAGQRFYYVKTPLPAGLLRKMLLEAGEAVAAGTKLKVETIFVRSLEEQHVFRFRFLVPNEKQFCCGNLCVDCYLLRENTSKDSRES
ncbi:hypothetical protein [Brevibacillus sp. H7]|uniref:hypothetical protein n=1 Tax=Brevibacillus sp. H7 TaxID=3349138 RepID=UPI00380421A2